MSFALSARRLQINLADDGTLDRVYTVNCRRCKATWEERFSNDGEGFPDKGTVRKLLEDAHAESSPDCYEAR